MDKPVLVVQVDDPLSVPVFSAVCVAGVDTNCGALSGDVHSEDELTRWIGEHCAKTGHVIYEQTAHTTVCAQPGDWP